jgi:tellurite resistance protein
MSQGKKLSIEDHAEKIRAELNVPRQNEVFKAAVEAGYLTARADGGVDATEREVLVQVVEILSRGLVLEWETDALIDEYEKLTDAEGLEGRAAKVGSTLKELGQAEAGIFVGAVVARATKGIDKSEAALLKAIGKSAGVANSTVGEIVKRASLIAE